MLRRIFSCFLFLCLGLVVTMFLLFSKGILPQYQESLMDEVQSLTNMQDEALLGGVLSPIDHTIAQLVASGDHNLAALAAMDAPTLRDSIEAFRYLDAQASLSGLYYSIDVYFPVSDTFLSACFGLINRDDSRSSKYFPWFQAYAEEDMDAHLHVSCYDVNLVAVQRQLITFSKPLQLSDGVNFRPCIIAFTLERSKLLAMLSIQQDTLPFYVEDSCGHRALVKEGVTIPSEAELIASPLGQDGFRVLRILPAVLQTRINDLLTMFVAGLAIIFLISCLVGYLISWRISAPMRMLARHLRRRYDQSLEPRSNEIAFILHAVSGLSDHTDRLEEALSQSRLIARQNFLHALLHGAVGTSPEIQRCMEQCALQFTHDHFSVLIIRFGAAVVSMMDTQDLQLLRASIHSRLAGSARDDLVIHIIETNDHDFHLLINHHQAEIVQRMKAILEECFGCGASALRSVVSGMSQPVEQPEQIATAFHQAVTALQQQYFSPNNNFFLYPACEEPLPAICAEIHGDFVKALDAQNAVGALAILMQIVDALRTGGGNAPATVKLDTLQDYWQALSRLSLPGLRAAVADYDDVDDLRQYIQSMMNELHSQADAAKALRRKQIVSSVTSYVDEHLSDMLSLGEAAEQVGLSASYLSKVFKDVTGENFNEYVNTRRLLCAQEQLLTSNHTVDEIARSLGFSSSNYFIKRFKQHFGVTPASYRAQQKNHPEA